MNKTNHYKKVHRNKLLDKIDSIDGQVFTRSDLSSDNSNKTQLRLNRAFKTFLEKGLIIKISHGLYAKAMKMRFPNGDVKIVLQEPFESVATEALDKLGIKWELGSAIQEYNRGETTQVPAVFSVKLRSRFRGTISAEGRTVIFEDDINAQ